MYTSQTPTTVDVTFDGTKVTAVVASTDSVVLHNLKEFCKLPVAGVLPEFTAVVIILIGTILNRAFLIM
jgi:hypothetical protein